MFACICVMCTMYVPSTWRIQNMALGPVKLELQTFVTTLWVLGTDLRASERAILLTTRPFLQPFHFHFYFKIFTHLFCTDAEFYLYYVVNSHAIYIKLNVNLKFIFIFTMSLQQYYFLITMSELLFDIHFIYNKLSSIITCFSTWVGLIFFIASSLFYFYFILLMVIKAGFCTCC